MCDRVPGLFLAMRTRTQVLRQVDSIDSVCVFPLKPICAEYLCAVRCRRTVLQLNNKTYTFKLYVQVLSFYNVNVNLVTQIEKPIQECASISVSRKKLCQFGLSTIVRSHTRPLPSLMIDDACLKGNHKLQSFSIHHRV